MGNASATKFIILEKAFELIYEKGYQATSIDDIIAKTRVTKGAFFYNFKNKEQMGLALINDFMAPNTYRLFVEPLIEAKDPVKDIYRLMHNILLENDSFRIECGCPVHNLIQEMGAINGGFNKALFKNIEMARNALVGCMERGIKNKNLRKDVDPEVVAQFIITGYAGIRNIGKLYKDKSCYKTHLTGLKKYLEGLK
ncbi:MAG: TetR/AcrR family transcriptional regulator [Bacteroidia bacterium]|nr:TetR/AcrR family transcriptional regulator [Bacteroidia bacterium]